MSRAVVTNPSVRNQASFRDPSGYVFHRHGRVFRAIDDCTHSVLKRLIDQGIISRLVDDQLLIDTVPVTDPQLHQKLTIENSGYRHFLEHKLITPITYPYEWTVSMLADAGLLTIDLQIRILEAGVSLKDATAYNVQFVRGRPTFIDISSFEQPGRLDIWFALGQFNQMFIFPLMLARYHGWDLRSYFLSRLNGMTVEEMARGLGRLERWRPRSLVDITLPALLKRLADRGDSGRRLLEQQDPNVRSQLANLKRVRRKIVKLAGDYKTRGLWAAYGETCTYDSAAARTKRDLVRDFIRTAQPSRVLDLGCNTGDYSFIAAESGASVMAVDSDHDCVETLYRRLRVTPANITPMVIDLGNPSPAIGFLNSERDSFLQRINADCVLGLALMHHLLVSANLSLSAIRDLLFDCTNEYLVLEFIPIDDAMFRRLMKFRVDLFEGLTLDACKNVFLNSFDLIKEAAIGNTGRTLLFLRKRTRLR